MTEHELITAFTSGSETALTELVHRHRARLFRAAAALVGDSDEAEDLVQETFVKAYFNRESFRGDSAIYTWLYRIMYNLCISAMRKKRPLKLLSFGDDEEQVDLPDEGPAPDANLLGGEVFQAVDQALKTLPERQRSVFVMKQLDDMKHQEIAAVMGISEGAVKASYFHAIQKLRRLLQPFRGEEDDL